MKKIVSQLTLATGLSLLFSCNNDNGTKDSVEKADSTNEAKMETSTPAIITTDEKSTSFLVDAANGGMSEVKLGELAQQKGTNQRVKDFGAMMVHDHSAAGDKVKVLAAARNVTLPADIDDECKKTMDDLMKKSGKDFDKAYIKNMVDDHQKDIKEFEAAAGNVGDSTVKTFITNTLPTLRIHLDSAKAIQKVLR